MSFFQTGPVPWPRAAIAELPGYVAGRHAVSPNSAALASNESHESPLPAVVEAIAAQASRVNRYPDMGAQALREAIARQVGLEVGRVAVGPGSVAVLQQAIGAFCEAGDEVVFAWRSFEAYPILTAIAQARAVRIPLRPDESHDLPAMADAVTERTKLVLLCSPNNPTGVPLSAADIAGFLNSVPPEILVVLDEAYIEYTADPAGAASLALLSRFPNLCLLRTLSKAYGLAGLRVGYGLADPSVADALRRTAIPFGVSSLAQAAGVAALAETAVVRRRAARIATERQRMIAALRRGGWTTPDSAANFIWLRTDDEFRARLLDAFDAADIMVRGYAGDGVRISLADAETNDRVLAVLAHPPRF